MDNRHWHEIFWVGLWIVCILLMVISLTAMARADVPEAGYAAPTSSVWHTVCMAAIMFLGIVAHVLKELIEVRKQEEVQLKDYLLAYPYRTVLMLVTAVGVFAILHEANQLTMAAAFAAGFTVDSSANLFSTRIKKVM